MCPAGEWFPLWVESAAVTQLMVKMPSDIASLPDSQTAFALRAMHGSGIGWRFECRQTVGAEYNIATKTGKRKPSDRKKAAPGGEGQKKMFPDCAEILQRLRPPHECDAQHAGFTRAALPLSAPEDQYSGFICLPMR